MSEIPSSSPIEPTENTDNLSSSIDEMLDDGEIESPRSPGRLRRFGREGLGRATSSLHLLNERVRGVYQENVQEPLQRRRAAARNREVISLADRGLAEVRPLDALVTDDVEILGESKHLGREMRQTTRDTTQGMHEAYVKTRNAIMTPRDEYLKFRRDRIALKVERLEHKVANSPDTLWNKHRKKTLEMFKKRQKWRENQLENRGKKKTSRIGKLETQTKKREEHYQKRIDFYVNKKVEALKHKELRKQMRDKGINPRNPFTAGERLKFLKTLSKKDKQHIVREAILAVRQENIKKGKLDTNYEVDETKEKRKIDNYERTT